MGRGTATRDTAAARLRELPAVHELAARLDAPHALAVAAARRAIDEQRAAVLGGAALDRERLLGRARALLDALELALAAAGDQRHRRDRPHQPGPRAARGGAREAVTRAAEGYSNLELDLESGERG